MVGISVDTVLTIQERKVYVGTFSRGTKYGFELYRFEREIFHPLFMGKVMYETESSARTAGEEFVDEVRSLDLTDKLPGLLRSDCVVSEGARNPE